MIQNIFQYIKDHLLAVIICIILVIVSLLVLVSELTKPSGESIQTIASSEQDLYSQNAQASRIMQQFSEQQATAPPSQPQSGQPMRPESAQPAQEPRSHRTIESEPVEQKDNSKEIATLEQEIQSIENQLTSLRAQDRKREQTHNELVRALKAHAGRIKSLGTTLQGVFKTPRQVRIMAENLKQEAARHRAAIETGNSTTGSSPFDKELWAAKRQVIDRQASDIEEIAAYLGRVSGDLSRIKVYGGQLQTKANEIDNAAEAMRNRAIEPNTALQSLEKQKESLNNRLQTLRSGK